MKIHQSPLRQLFVVLLFSCVGNIVFSQVESTWVGGTPGMETDWNCAKNWSTYRVPDHFTNVFIRDVSTSTCAYPVIYNELVEVNAFFMDESASLTLLQNARLVIYSEAAGWEKLEGTVFIIKENEGVDPHGTTLRTKIMN
jgi:hypothetical protein